MWPDIVQHLTSLVVQSRLASGQIEIVVHEGCVCRVKVSPYLVICSQGSWDLSPSHAVLQSLNLRIVQQSIGNCNGLICGQLLNQHGRLSVDVVNNSIRGMRIDRKAK